MPEINVFRTTLGVAAVLGVITLYGDQVWDRVRRARKFQLNGVFLRRKLMS